MLLTSNIGVASVTTDIIVVIDYIFFPACDFKGETKFRTLPSPPPIGNFYVIQIYRLIYRHS